MTLYACGGPGVPGFRVTEDLITRLRKRAEIRRGIPRGEPDRIADILEEAANEIERLRRQPIMPDELFRLVESTLSYYGEMSEARMGARTGGILQGCPRGEPYIDRGRYADQAQFALQEWVKGVGEAND